MKWQCEPNTTWEHWSLETCRTRSRRTFRRADAEDEKKKKTEKKKAKMISTIAKNPGWCPKHSGCSMLGM